jgi:light-regulated signal transduction histidine kinase (bacteriophytochrome)
MPSPSNAVPPPPPTPDRELADFSYVVSHDLGNCFRQISGFLNLLEDELGDALTPRQKGYIDRVCDASAFGRAMLDELLVFSRIQQHHLSLVACDANKLARDALIVLAQEIHDSGAVFEIADLGEALADTDLLRELFRRVFENAVKFRRPDEAPKIRVEVVPDDQDWIVHVKDNGVGVPDGQFENIFRMFHRLEPGQAGAGVGSGLTICRRMARLHKGEVVMRESEVGACVEIRLPKTPFKQD